jgi:hypothetical protein
LDILESFCSNPVAINKIKNMDVVAHFYFFFATSWAELILSCEGVRVGYFEERKHKPQIKIIFLEEIQF